jgi:hypothetical protein
LSAKKNERADETEMQDYFANCIEDDYDDKKYRDKTSSIAFSI